MLWRHPICAVLSAVLLDACAALWNSRALVGHDSLCRCQSGSAVPLFPAIAKQAGVTERLVLVNLTVSGIHPARPAADKGQDAD